MNPQKPLRTVAAGAIGNILEWYDFAIYGYIDWIEPEALPFLPQWNYLHIEQEVLPYLRDHGVTEQQITTMLVANPRRFFEGG